MANIRYLFAIFFFFFTCLLHAQTEGQLRNILQKTKDKTSHLQARLHLLEYLEENNRSEWLAEINLLEKQQNAYTIQSDQKLVQLILAEKELYLGAIQKGKALFDRYLHDFQFQNKELEWRRRVLAYSFSTNSAATEFPDLLSYSRKYLKNKRSAQLYQIQAERFLFIGNIDSATFWSEQSVQIAKRSEGKWVLINALESQAELFWQTNQLEKAVQRSIYSLQLAEEAQLPYFKIRPLLLIAAISLEVGNEEQAFVYAKRAQHLANQFSDPYFHAYAGIILSDYYFSQHQFQKAQYFIQSPLAYFHKIENAWAYHQALLSEAVILDALQKNPSSNFALLTNYFSKHEKSMLSDKYHYTYGLFLLKHKDFGLAESHFKILVEQVSKIEALRPQIAAAYAQLAKIEVSKGNLKLALQYQQAYSDWLAKSPVWKSAARIEEMTSSNLREERERLIDFQRASIEKAQKERKIIELQKDRQLFISIIFIVAIIFGVVIFILRIQQARIKQEQREAELSQTLLRTQMNPHFVFNAMSVIQSYIYENDPAKSSQFLVNFSRLMRLILENSPKEFIQIELEIEILDKYLATQKMRFENRFDYTLDISDDLLFNKAMVPPMITQPFIENSIEHGQLHTVPEGHIIVQMRAENGALYLRIEDNGVGRTKSQKTKKIRTHKSMAIDITRERIEIINKKYKFNGSLQFEDLNKTNQTGTVVKLVLPLRYDTSI
ncbi:MAG: hypothetical protein RLZZ65_94 [Bacteroidota bacterium]|jgi:two-component sensor histidine kinase